MDTPTLTPAQRIAAIRAFGWRPGELTTDDRQAAREALTVAFADARAEISAAILEILRAGRVPLGALPTESAILYAVDHLDVRTEWSPQPSFARTVLLRMVGERVAGQVVKVIGYCGGSEVYGLVDVPEVA